MQELNNEKVLSLMSFRLKTWEGQAKKQAKEDKFNVDVCLIASIADVKDDIKTIKRAIQLNENYKQLLFGE